MMGIETLNRSRTLKEGKSRILGGLGKVHGLIRTHTPQQVTASEGHYNYRGKEAHVVSGRRVLL